ncbi:MAG: FadR/GntR family transcriptional regulator [Pseudonocardia sp.]
MDHELDGDSRFDLQRDAARPLPDVIADKLRELIDAGLYKPGGRLHAESELARRWKVARSSVRTALQRLETLGILESRHGRGWYVRRTRPVERPLPGLLHGRRFRVSDLFELRMGLEGLAASLAAIRATLGEIEDIAKLNQRHLDSGDDLDELVDSDRAFHEAIVAASRNELLIETYRGLIGELDESRRQSFSRIGMSVRSAREHTKIVRYIRNRDPGGARMAMNSHLQRLYDEIADIDHEPMDTTHSGPEAETEWHDRGGQG